MGELEKGISDRRRPEGHAGTQYMVLYLLVDRWMDEWWTDRQIKIGCAAPW